MLTSRAIIPNIYTKERVSDLANIDITDEEWNFMIKNQYILTSEYNDIMKDWIKYIWKQKEDDNYLDDLDDSTENSNDITIINKLENLPYTVLQNIAEINNKSKKKKELVQIIISKIKQYN
jgi:hypothetical protein